MKHTAIIAAAACATIMANACTFVRINRNSDILKSEYIEINPDGVRFTKDFDVTAFDELSVNGSFNVTYVPGEPSVSITADEKVMEHIRVKVADGELKIDFGHKKISKTGEIDVKVSCPVLNDLNLAGSCTFDAPQGIIAEDFDANLAGSCRMTAACLTAQGDADLVIAGSGEALLKSIVCGDIDLQIAGSGNIAAEGVECRKDIDLGVAGSGNITISGTNGGDTDITIAGSGKVDISGLVTKGATSREVSGSGKVLKVF